MSTQLPFAMHSWYSIVRRRSAPNVSLQFDGAFDRHAAECSWRQLVPGEALAIVRRSTRGLLRSVVANRGRASQLTAWARGLEDRAEFEHSFAFPSTGGGFVLIDSQTRAAFAAGTRMLPAGRRRWKLLRSLLARFAKFGLHERLGLEELCVVVKRDERSPATDTNSEHCLALSSGVPGSFQTTVAQIANAAGQIESYIKCATGTEAAASLEWEGEVLNRLPQLALKTAATPKLLYRGQSNHCPFIVQEALTGTRSPDELRRAHLDFLAELSTRTRATIPFEKCEGFASATIRMRDLESRVDQAWLDSMRTVQATLANRLGSSSIPSCLAHGDFTPWNTLLAEDRLGVFDWEFAQFEAPLLHDLFHFIVQTDVLVTHATDVLHSALPAQQILARIREVLAAPARDLLEPLAQQNCEWMELLLLYLFEITVRDEWQHSKERPSFEQVTWLREARLQLIRVVLTKLEPLSPSLVESERLQAA